MPITDFLLDSTTGGLAVINGDFAVVGGQTNAQNIEAVRQGIQTRLRLYLGEDWLNETDGTPWFQVVLVKNPNPTTINQALTAQIAATPGVTSVTQVDFAFDRPNRRATISYTVTTAYSSAPLTGTVTQ